MTDEERVLYKKGFRDYLGGSKGLGYTERLEIHRECHGTGRIGSGECVYCGGSGRVLRIQCDFVVPFEENGT